MINKLLKILKNPLSLFLLWMSFLLSPLLAFFRLHYVVDKNFFGSHIRGLSTLLFYFPFIMSALAFTVLTLWLKGLVEEKLLNFHKKILLVLSVLTLIFLVVAVKLLNLQYSNYPNYLYEHYGLTLSQLELMSFVAALGLLTFIVVFLYGLRSKIGGKSISRKQVKMSEMKDASYFVAIIGILCLIILSGQTFINWPILSREARGDFENKVGVHYKYLESLAEHVPKDGTIIHPPQGDKWPAIGNQPVIRYFLYPRKLISGVLMNNQEFAENLGSVYFVEIDPDLERTHWPEINKDKALVIFDEKTEISYKELKIYHENDGIIIFIVSF